MMGRRGEQWRIVATQRAKTRHSSGHSESYDGVNVTYWPQADSGCLSSFPYIDSRSSSGSRAPLRCVLDRMSAPSACSTYTDFRARCCLRTCSLTERLGTAGHWKESNVSQEEEFATLETEEENDESPFVEFDISVSPSDPTLELLASQVQRGDIIIPFYQRLFVWKIEQSSKLIKSFLMGLPVPQVFLYVNDEGQLEVMDGQQRIKSVTYFFEGYFGEPDHQNRRQIFKLKGLSERSEYNGKTFLELSARDQRKLRNSTLRAINIKQLKPSLRNDSVFHIFERLNTGGTQLKPQEIRNAVYRGKIVDELRALSTKSGVANGSWHHTSG